MTHRSAPNQSNVPPAMLTRRTLAAGAGWAVPVVVTAGSAPVLAASWCRNPATGHLNSTQSTFGTAWTRSVANDLKSATASGPVRTSDAGGVASGYSGSVAVNTTITGSARLQRDNATDAVGHLSGTSSWGTGTFSGIYNPIPITNQTTGCRGKDSAGNYAHRQTTCFTFPEVVYDLHVGIGDIDAMAGSAPICENRYRDNVALTATVNGKSVQGGTLDTAKNTSLKSQVVGSGTVADPFRRAENYLPPANDPWSSTTGTVYTTFRGGPITQLCVDFWSGEGGGLQVVLIDLDFQYCP